MTNKKLTNRQAIGVLDGLWSNPLFGEAHRQAFEIGIMAIKALEQEPCEDAVSRQEILDYLDKMPSELTSDGRRMVRRRTLEEYISDTLPPVTPQSKMGQWIYKQYGSYPEQGDYHCSECDGIDNRIPAYCPNCGAKMIEPQERSNKK